MQIKTLIFSVLSFLMSLVAFSQNRPIVYRLPKDVESEAYGYMQYTTKTAAKEKRPCFFSFMLDERDGLFQLYCDVSSDSVSTASAARPESTRRLLIRSELYQLNLIGYDEPFCEFEPDSLKEFGARHGKWPDGESMVKKRSFMLCNVESIKFRRNTCKVEQQKYLKYARTKSECVPRAGYFKTDNNYEEHGYFISDDVEAEVNAYMKYTREHCSDSLSFTFIMSKGNDRYHLYPMYRRSSSIDEIEMALGKTDRFLIVNDEFVPLYFDTDFIFANSVSGDPVTPVFTGPCIGFRTGHYTVIDREFTGPWKMWK